jgi:hypothetical protein
MPALPVSKHSTLTWFHMHLGHGSLASCTRAKGPGTRRVGKHRRRQHVFHHSVSRREFRRKGATQVALERGSETLREHLTECHGSTVWLGYSIRCDMAERDRTIERRNCHRNSEECRRGLLAKIRHPSPCEYRSDLQYTGRTISHYTISTIKEYGTESAHTGLFQTNGFCLVIKKDSSFVLESIYTETDHE